MKKAKTLFVIASFLLVLSGRLSAQSPQGIPYQAEVRDNNGNTLPNQNVSLRFSIHDGTVSGTVVYQETQSVTTSNLGLFSVNIGQGTAVTGTFSGINWASGAKFTQVEMDVTGGTSYTDMGTQQMMSVPYALYAGSSAETDPQVSSSSSNQIPKWNGSTLTDGIVTDNGTNVGIGTTSPAQKLDVNGTTKTTNLQMTSGAGSGKVLQSDAAGNASWINSTSLSVSENDPQVSSSLFNKIPKWNGSTLTDGLIYDNGSSVVVGGTTPRGYFDVAGTGDIWLSNNGTNSGTQSIYLPAHIFIAPYDGTNISYVQARRSDNSGTTNLRFRTYNNGSVTEAMHIDGVGNVGIGTTSPAYKLDVNGTVHANNLLSNFFQLIGSAGAGKLLQSDANGVGTWVSPSSISFTETDPQVSSSTSNQIPKWNGSTLTDGIVTDNGTNVGIGTTSPAQKLDVNGTTKTTSLQMTSGAGAGKLLQSDASGNASWVTPSSVETDPQVSSATTNQIPKWNGTALTDGIVTDNGTNIGIGTTSPSQKLEVNGTTKTTSLQVTSGAATGKVLQSDASGNATWTTIPEVDPKIASSTTNTIPKWNGTVLTDGIITDNGTNIGLGTSTPSFSALLDLSSTTKGVTIPRMTTPQRDAIASPVTGLQIFNLDDNCINIYDGTYWIETCGLKVSSTIVDASHSTTNSWASKAVFPGAARSRAVAFSIDSKGYLGTGTDVTLRSDFWEYDPASNVWTQKANFGGGVRMDAVGFSIGSKGYIGTGFGSTYMNDFYEYDPVANTWTSRASFPGVGRADAVGFSVGTKGYLGTGSASGVKKNDFYEFNPSSNSWVQKANCPDVWDDAIGFSIRNYGYVGIGTNGSGLSNNFWEFDPAANTWTQKTNFAGTARSNAACFTINSCGYVGTGTDVNNIALNDMWKYDPLTNAWTQRANVPAAYYNVSGFSVGPKGYLSTGQTSGSSLYFAFLSEYMDNNIDGYVYSGNTVSSSNNIITNGAWTQSGNTVYNSNSGNIGIGNTSPAAKLDVTGNALFSGNVGIGTVTPVSKLDVEGGLAVGSTYAGTTAAPTNGAIIEGNVGLGTTTPRGHFDVDGPGDIWLTNDGTNSGTQSLFLPGQLFLAPYNGSDISYLQARRSDNSGTTALRLRTYNAGVLTESMHIEGNGNVGIGTVTPSQKLEVNGITKSTNVQVSSLAGTNNRIVYVDANGNLKSSANISKGTNKIYFTRTPTVPIAITPTSNTISVEVGDVIVIEAQVTLRLTSGNGVDPFTISVANNGSAVLTYSTGFSFPTTLDYTPGEDANDHDNPIPVSYLEYATVTTAGSISYSLMVGNSGNDNWEHGNAIVIARKF